MSLDLGAVLDHYGVAWRAGRTNQKVRCVVHDDTDPSMNINLDKGLWFCHACGEGGSALDLVMKKEELDLADARAFAADLGLPSGGTDGRGDEVQLGLLAGRRVHGPKGDQRGKRRYVPSWRR